MSADYLRGVRDVCDEFGLLMFLDEVQCGMGRTGKLFAYEWAGVRPDVMALAKGLGGGFPVGACLATEEAASGMAAGSHGSTFGGNPLATAVVNAVLDVLLADGFLDGVQARAGALHERLQALAARYPDVLLEVRGMGMMIGMRTGPANGEFVGALRRQGLLAVPAADNVVRLLPPLVVEESHIGEAVGMVEGACREFAAAAA